MSENLTKTQLKLLVSKNINRYYKIYLLFLIIDIFINFLIIVIVPILGFFIILQTQWFLWLISVLTAFQNFILKTNEQKNKNYAIYLQLQKLLEDIQNGTSDIQKYNNELNNIIKNNLFFNPKISSEYSHTEEELYQLQRIEEN